MTETPYPTGIGPTTSFASDLRGRRNRCRLVSVALDRGFLDGDLLWWLKQARGIDWYCPGKEQCR